MRTENHTESCSKSRSSDRKAKSNRNLKLQPIRRSPAQPAVMRLSASPCTPSETRSSTPEQPSWPAWTVTVEPASPATLNDEWCRPPSSASSSSSSSSSQHPQLHHSTPNPYAHFPPSEQSRSDLSHAKEDRKRYKEHNLRLIGREKEWQKEKAEMEETLRMREEQMREQTDELASAKLLAEVAKSALLERDVMKIQNSLLHARMVAIMEEKNGGELKYCQLKQSILSTLGHSI